MRIPTTLWAVAASAALVSPALALGGDVCINEVRIDQPSTDNDEYFELRGTPGASLDGLTYVVIGDGATGSGTIDTDGVIDLSGNVIPASGYFVAAESTFTLGTADLTTSLGFENSDNVTHLLVTDFTGAAGDDLDTDDDGVLDVTPWTSIVDVVALIETPGAGDQTYGPPNCGPDGSFVPGHFFREGDGTGSLVHYAVGNFDPFDAVDPVTDTPGAANTSAPRLPQMFGGTMGMSLDAGVANAGSIYFTLLSASGTAPGTPAGALTLPLNFDNILLLSLQKAGTGPFVNTFGFLDANGQAPFNQIVFPPLGVGFLGLTINAASVAVDPITLVPSFVSNAVGVTFD